MHANPDIMFLFCFVNIFTCDLAFLLKVSLPGLLRNSIAMTLR